MRVERIESEKGSLLRICEDKAGIFYQERMMPRLPVLVSGRFISQHEAEFIAPAEAQPISRILKRPIRKEELDRILEAFEASIGLLESYLLDKEKLWWDPGWIFYDGRENKVYLVYLPWEEDPGRIGIERQLCRYLWLTASFCGWEEDLWESVGKFSVQVYGQRDRIIQKTIDPEKEKVLDDLMAASSFLPPLVLRKPIGEKESRLGLWERLKTEIKARLHGW
ncbi:MAG: hypothetical protein J5589_12710 [Firmicutes bacterium]|nr:hypothetical protein [Bacillota bacterium]